MRDVHVFVCGSNENLLVSSPSLGTNLDIGNYALNGQDVPAAIRALGPRIVYAHLKHNRRVDDKNKYTLVFLYAPQDEAVVKASMVQTGRDQARKKAQTEEAATGCSIPANGRDVAKEVGDALQKRLRSATFSLRSRATPASSAASTSCG